MAIYLHWWMTQRSLVMTAIEGWNSRWPKFSSLNPDPQSGEPIILMKIFNSREFCSKNGLADVWFLFTYEQCLPQGSEWLHTGAQSAKDTLEDASTMNRIPSDVFLLETFSDVPKHVVSRCTSPLVALMYAPSSGGLFYE